MRRRSATNSANSTPSCVRMIDRYHAARVGDLSRRKKPAVQETLLEKGSPQA